MRGLQPSAALRRRRRAPHVDLLLPHRRMERAVVIERDWRIAETVVFIDACAVLLFADHAARNFETPVSTRSDSQSATANRRESERVATLKAQSRSRSPNGPGAGPGAALRCVALPVTQGRFGCLVVVVAVRR